MASEEVRKKYGINELLRRIPEDQAEFFEGYTPSPEDLEGWTRTRRDRLPDVAGRQLIRTIVGNLQERELRLLIDVVECSSPGDAIEALADNLAANQLERLPEGPRTLGLAAFVHPDGAPPAVFFVRGNLSIIVASFGGRPVEVTAVATRLAARLSERPGGETRPFRLAPVSPRGKAGEETALDYQLPVRPGEDAYVKFFASGGTLARKGERLFVRPKAPGRVQMEAYLVEPGRDVYSARATLDVE
jgi:hypothetical protein